MLFLGTSEPVENGTALTRGEGSITCIEAPFAGAGIA